MRCFRRGGWSPGFSGVKGVSGLVSSSSELLMKGLSLIVFALLGLQSSSWFIEPSLECLDCLLDAATVPFLDKYLSCKGELGSLHASGCRSLSRRSIPTTRCLYLCFTTFWEMNVSRTLRHHGRRTECIQEQVSVGARLVFEISPYFFEIGRCTHCFRFRHHSRGLY